jgi:hypothetical protein
MPTGSRRLLFGLVCVFVAVTRADAQPVSEHRKKGDLAIRARAVLSRHCGGCHTGKETPGESLLPVLDRSEVVSKKPPLPFVTPGDPDHSLLLQLISDGSMPPGGRDRPSGEDVVALRAWVQGGAPGYPRAFDDHTTLEEVLADLGREEKEDPTRVPFLRYVSFAHLARDDAKVPDLFAAERRFARALQAASEASPVADPVDSTATLFRLDIRTLGWHHRDLFRIDADDQAARVAPALIPYDLVLLEYPFGFIPQPRDPLADPFDRFRSRVPQFRPVPFVRGDWLTDALLRGDGRSPLADELYSLKVLGEAVEKKRNAPAGPVARLFPKGMPAVVPFPGAEGWQRPVPPFGSVYTRDVVQAKPPFMLKAEIVGMGGPTATVAVDELFQIKVTSDQDVYLLVLYVLADGSMRVQDVAGAAAGGLHVKAGTTYLSPPKKKAFQIGSLLTGGDSGQESYVVFASTKPLTLPTIVESRHASPTVWRFLLDPEKVSDPESVVRTVVPFTLTAK